VPYVFIVFFSAKNDAGVGPLDPGEPSLLPHGQLLLHSSQAGQAVYSMD